MLNYGGEVGQHYNPIAIAQYGLACYNAHLRGGSDEAHTRFMRQADWMVANLEENAHGVRVWNHHFNWEYRKGLVAPWYSGLAQGQGLSLLVRAAVDTGDSKYQDAARAAFESFRRDVEHGGVLYTDGEGSTWIEEYLVDPPSHILNGFMWASWGLHDYALATGATEARDLFDRSADCIERNLARYDAGFWSLYEQSPTRIKMLASPFYHRLHIVQLRVMHRLTAREAFLRYADRWASFERARAKRALALGYKALFKVVHY